MSIERQARMRHITKRIAGRLQDNPLFTAAPRGLLALRALNEKARSKALPFVRKPQAKVYGRIGNLEVRLAQGRKDILRAQRLRFEVFYEEMSATPSVIAGMRRLDQDPYDAVCDHLLVEDRSTDTMAGETWTRTRRPHVVGTYRVLRQEVAQRSLGFYTASEYDIDPLIAAKSPRYRFMELGRSCVLRPYRTKRSVELLWHGLWTYIREHKVDVMIGCASFEGTDPGAHAMALSFLHHHALAPPEWRCRAHDHLYVPMDRIPRDKVDAKQALKALPPLIKGYLRLGAFVGDGAVIDRQFGTTDVFVILPVENIDPRYFDHFGAPDELKSRIAAEV
ncbi:GNAT family N-acetyltransferase [Hyphomicrobium zavarzinii]|jgi:putative hemolysin|uniref:GNAT family N-acetyltransferase n=1 Tax=Hyphomicrobium zavarzinii TaxID=48292 RepID=UPI002355C53C|nr:GNAT family N-acyltransferase [Hyphomicrobium zavarzinii]HML43896.1 GNAT family N-acyltransferase [Hyphomicrobium zavarzinii]